MLKIKDDVDLKELEKFGFKPKYDVDTGELKEYYKEFVDDDRRHYPGETIKFYIKKEKRFFKTYYSCRGGTWDIFHYKYGYEIIDILYDLIQANIVEKVDDK